MILLTGGTGYVGRHLARQLVADFHRVRVLSRTPGRVALPDAVSWAPGDLTDPVSLRAAMTDIRTVVHAAAVVPDGQTPDALLERVNAHGTGTLARIARDMGIRQFIHIGSAGVYGDGSTATPHRERDTPQPGTPYERSKLAAERALASTLEGSEVAWTILRPAGLYGPDRRATVDLFRRVAHSRVWLHGPARVLVHPTHITDLVTAVRLIIGRSDLGHESINIGGARSLDYADLIEQVGLRVGHVPLQFRAPRWTGRLAVVGAAAWEAFGNAPASLARFSRTWVNRALCIEKARRLLGFEPVALEWGLDQTMEELRRQEVI